VRQTLKKTNSSLTPDQSTEFVYHMEDVLSLYREPYDPTCPVVCFDEHPVQLVEHVREPRPAEPGTVACVRGDDDTELDVWYFPPKLPELNPVEGC